MKPVVGVGFKAIIAPIVNSIQGGGNSLILMVGRTRSGKSYAALRLAELISNFFKVDFKPKVQVVFTAQEFFNVLSLELPRGSVIIFDEAGVGIPSKEWWNINNRMVSVVAQTFGHMGYVVIFTTPHMGYIDKDVRHLFHILIKTVKLNKEEGKCRTRFLKLRIDPERSNRIWKRRPVWFDESGRHQAAFVDFNKPEKETCLDYEVKSQAYKMSLVHGAKIKIDDSVRRDEASKIDLNSIVSSVKNNMPRYVHAYRGKQLVKQSLVENDFKVGGAISKRVADLISSELNG